MELFEDRENGGIFQHGGRAAQDLVLRLKDDYDGAEPSGNSAMALALLRLARMTGPRGFSRVGASGRWKHSRREAADWRQRECRRCWWRWIRVGQPREIVIAGPRGDGFNAMLGVIRRRFLPHAVILRAEDVARPMPSIDGQATAYVCENYACKLPATTVQELNEQLQ